MNRQLIAQTTRRVNIINKRCFRSTPLRRNNAEDIERLNQLIKKKLIEVEEAEKKRILEESKPKISDFKRPILTTFVIASTAYLTLHLLWWHLEYPIKEEQLKEQLQTKEKELQDLIDEQTKELGLGPDGSVGSLKSNKGWLRWIKLW